MDHLIHLVDFKRQWEATHLQFQAAFERVGRSGWLILGQEVAAFERGLAAALGLPHAVGVANGTDALELSLRALGGRPGDVYLTTPLTAFATTLAILRAGGQPRFVDVDASGNLDLEQAARHLEGPGPRPRFLVPVHMFGHAMDLDRLEHFTRAHDLLLVEDCAHAIGARSRGRPVGTVGGACAISFYPTKNLGAMGDGGAVLTRDQGVADQVRCMRDYGQTSKYLHERLGLNSRLDEVQAALLSVQLSLLAEHNRRRVELATKLLAGLSSPRVRPVPIPAGSESVWHLFPVLVEGNREAFREHLHAQGVASGLHYPHLVSEQRALADAGLSMPGGDWPMARRFTTQEVSLPLHPYLRDDEAQQVIDACNSWSG